MRKKNNELIITDFNELEAYKVASKIEQDGIEFYQELSKTLKNNKVTQDKISFLLQEEKKHLKFFQERLFEIRKNIEDNFEEDDLLKYMDYGIFNTFKDIATLTKKIDDIKKALGLGVAVEEKSIKFYEICKNNVSAQNTKKEIDKIIEEEKKHKALFESLLNLEIWK
ncbi:MAG: ferritin family protein [Candidatus Omnitrophota bacterium]